MAVRESSPLFAVTETVRVLSASEALHQRASLLTAALRPASKLNDCITAVNGRETAQSVMAPTGAAADRKLITRTVINKDIFLIIGTNKKLVVILLCKISKNLRKKQMVG